MKKIGTKISVRPLFQWRGGRRFSGVLHVVLQEMPNGNFVRQKITKKSGKLFMNTVQNIAHLLGQEKHNFAILDGRKGKRKIPPFGVALLTTNTKKNIVSTIMYK